MKQGRTVEEKKADRRIRLERKQQDKKKIFGWKYEGAYQLGRIRFQEGYTLIEATLAIALIGILVAVALPRMVAPFDAGINAVAVATLEAGQEAVRLDFAQQIIEGNYKDPFTETKKEGKKLHPKDQEKLETMLQDGFNYPAGFNWILVERGSTTSAPVLGVQLNGKVL